MRESISKEVYNFSEIETSIKEQIMEYD